MTNIFEGMTNLYSLSKTLRFELKPVGKTLENMQKNLKYDPELETFLHDQDIEDAYQLLKPEIDKLHEEFITMSLESDKAKEIDFSNYLENYKNKQDDKGENELRKKIGETYNQGSKKFKEKYNILAIKGRKKGTKEVEGANVMQTEDLLNIIKENNKDDAQIIKALGVFSKFYTYLSGYNQNRANYYETKDEKSTAIATRIIHVNLPKYCDNSLTFNAYKDEYLLIYGKLQKLGKLLQINDKHTGKTIDINNFDNKVFDILSFNNYLTQSGIKDYNSIINGYNVLVNLYNQNIIDKNDKKLEKFKTLHKQIGCGERNNFIKAITHNTKEDIIQDKKNVPNPISVEEIVEQISFFGNKIFTSSINEEIVTIPRFISRLKNQQNRKGVYRSKKAVDIISNSYFNDWATLKELMKGNKTLVSFDKKREEQIKVNDAVELHGLFETIDNTQHNWKEHFFSQSLLDNEKTKEIIDSSTKASQALLHLICRNIEENIKYFLQGTYTYDKKNEQGEIIGSEDMHIKNIRKYKEEKSIEAIKTWMDSALTVLQTVRYFKVPESKVKGDPIQTELTEYLDTLLSNSDDSTINLFAYYDLLRNYLTKKEKDNAQENKLKLNFESSSLLGGWSDGQEKIKKAVLIKKENNYYLGILKKNSLFDTDNENNLIYCEGGNAGRLILANLKFQTLAGKGFLGEFGESYGTMGEKNPQKAVVSLQKIILDRYVKKYPLLEKIGKGKYNDKKKFDKDIQTALKECYICEFKQIDWHTIEQSINDGHMYLFTISNKDYSKNSIGKPNLQTLYREAVFNNINQFQLNGGAEIFFRKTGISEKKSKKGYENKPRIIEGKRFTENNELSKGNNIKDDKNGKSFFFHCPIKLNYKGADPKYSYGPVNKEFHEKISTKENLYFLGLDRGEKHLIYYSIVDSQGNNVDQGSFNIINGKDYHEELSKREGERMDARKNRQKINSIAKLKEGYISLVVHEIVKKLSQKPGYIVLEDLNTGFKQGRQKIEKSIYQKFELALAKKLNFLVDKNAEEGQLGSVTNALQLTPYLQNYSDIEYKKQFGIMLYTRANYTSQTDPVTGWRKTIYLKKGSEIKEQIFEYFTDIGFNGTDYYFHYTDKIGNNRTLWSSKNGEDLLRYRGKRTKEKNIRETEKVAINIILDGLFAGFDKNNSLLLQLKNGKEMKKVDQKNTSWESLRYIIDIIQQIRNSADDAISKKCPLNNNFLLSPIRDNKGNHFDSREQKDGLPQDADANGAFNIARKGVIMNEHIKQWISSGSKKDDLDLFVSEEERDLWLTDRIQWKELLPIFASRRGMEDRRKKRK